MSTSSLTVKMIFNEVDVCGIIFKNVKEYGKLFSHWQTRGCPRMVRSWMVRSGSFAKNDVHFKASYESWPPCTI